MPTDLPAPGDLFEGKYRIERQIGSGGFAAVFRAIDESTDRTVAIKILVPLAEETSYSEKLHARFEREARLLAGLRSSHTVTMYEFGQSDAGTLYLVFEFVDGTTLRNLVKIKGAQSAERVVAIVRQVCTALHEAHALGVLHRDIKPANIMVYDHLEMRDVAKLLDFGIAKSMRPDPGPQNEHTITTAGAVLGTPRYMSPEQFAQQELTPASDIYSLGLVAFELLAGQQAFGEETVTGVMRAQMSDQDVEFPPELLVPQGLRYVIQKMTHKRRDDRYQDITGVLRDLERWEEGEVAGRSRWSAVGLVVGVALLFGAVLLGQRERKQLDHVPPPATLGAPAWDVSIETVGLNYIRLSSTKEYELLGGSAPSSVDPIVRAVVAVEREGVAVEPGFRWVGDMSSWDGQSLDYRFIVRRVHEEEFYAMTTAQMAVIPLAREVIAHMNKAAVAQAERLGLKVDVTPQRSWSPPETEVTAPPHGIRLHSERGTVGDAESRAERAIKSRDWSSARDYCTEYTSKSRKCAAAVALAASKQGDLKEACKLYKQLGRADEHGCE